MLLVAIFLPSGDNFTDIRFGTKLLMGTYDQAWSCVKSKNSDPDCAYDNSQEDSLIYQGNGTDIHSGTHQMPNTNCEWFEYGDTEPSISEGK